MQFFAMPLGDNVGGTHMQNLVRGIAADRLFNLDPINPFEADSRAARPHRQFSQAGD
jgi:hypothetical protein